MATLQNIGKLKYRGKDGLWHPLPVVVQDTGGGVSTISGKGAPTSETQGKVNQLYRDEDTQKLYICTATDGGYTWAEVSGGSVDVDATLTNAGQAADAKAAGDAIGKKIDKAQGTGNAGKILGIGADGNVTPQDKPVQALAGASVPTTATDGVVGQEYYVIVDNAVTEMYVCTAVANGTYTWDKVEFGAEETDPTVPAWAKAAQKPSYTASEVGADPSGTAASQVSAHNTGTDTHSDIRLLISGLTDRLNALADSDDTTMDQLSEVVAYIKANRELITSITTDKVSVSDIIDNLTTNVTNKPLSAAQGVSLKALIDGIVIPDKLPNPNALTFTGAVTGSYDGSAPLSVAIPSGEGGTGGGGDVFELIGEATSSGVPDTVGLTIPFDGSLYKTIIAYAYNLPAGNQKRIIIRKNKVWYDGSPLGWNGVNDTYQPAMTNMKDTWGFFGAAIDVCGKLFTLGAAESNNNGGHGFFRLYPQTGALPKLSLSNCKFISLDCNSKSEIIPDGCSLIVWGVRK